MSLVGHSAPIQILIPAMKSLGIVLPPEESVGESPAGRPPPPPNSSGVRMTPPPWRKIKWH